MALRLSTGLRDALAGVIRTSFLDGVIDVYDGPQPANPNDPPSGTLIGQITVNGDPFNHGAPANGLEFQVVAGSGQAQINPSENWVFNCATSGTARYGRLKTNAADANGTSVTQQRMDFAIGISTGEVRMPRVDFTAGETSAISSLAVPFSMEGC